MRMVGVFKTNVDGTKAKVILEEIRRHFPESDPSFDLENRDNVLRVESLNGSIDAENVKKIVQNAGFEIDQLT